MRGDIGARARRGKVAPRRMPLRLPFGGCRSDFLAAVFALMLFGNPLFSERAVRRAADQHEMPVAIAAIRPADILGNLQPYARMAERGGNFSGAVAGDAAMLGANGFGRLLHNGQGD